MMRKVSLALTAGVLLLALCGIAYAVNTELSGEITAIDYGVKTLEVAGTTVYTTELTTVIINGEVATFGDLLVGQYVKVMGCVTDDQFVAVRICVQGDQNRYQGQ